MSGWWDFPTLSFSLTLPVTWSCWDWNVGLIALRPHYYLISLTVLSLILVWRNTSGKLSSFFLCSARKEIPISLVTGHILHAIRFWLWAVIYVWHPYTYLDMRNTVWTRRTFIFIPLTVCLCLSCVFCDYPCVSSLFESLFRFRFRQLHLSQRGNSVSCFCLLFHPFFSLHLSVHQHFHPFVWVILFWTRISFTAVRGFPKWEDDASEPGTLQQRSNGGWTRSHEPPQVGTKHTRCRRSSQSRHCCSVCPNERRSQ